MSALTTFPFINGTTKNCNYVGFYGLNWDQKKHATDVVAYREGKEWIVSGNYLVNCQRPAGARVMTDACVGFVNRSWRVTLGKDVAALPVGCTTKYVVGSKEYTVIEVPCFIEVVLAGKVYQVVGCLGSSKDGTHVFATISPADEWLLSMDAEVYDVDRVLRGSIVPDPRNSSNPNFLALFAEKEPSYAPSSPKDPDEAQERKDELEEVADSNARALAFVTELTPVKEIAPAMRQAEPPGPTGPSVNDGKEKETSVLRKEDDGLVGVRVKSGVEPAEPRFVLKERNGGLIVCLPVYPKEQPKKKRHMNEEQLNGYMSAMSEAVRTGKKFDHDVWLYETED